jgi:hypothetical protein
MILNVSRDDDDAQQLNFRIVTRMKNKKAIAIDAQFLQYVCAIQDDLVECIDKIPICAEHCRAGEIFRAHPNYRGKGPWRDWVMIEWQTGEYPAQICGFLDLTQLTEGASVKLSNGTVVQKGVWAVIESCDYVNIEDGQRKSEIFTPIIMETQIDPSLRRFYLVDVETFKNPLVVIPNIGTKREYLMMTAKAQWGPDFVHWIMQPHHIDEAEMRENPAPELEPKKPKKTKAPAAKKAAIGHEDSESGSESGTSSSGDSC